MGSNLIDLRVAVKARGDFLALGGVRQEVAGQLFDGELIERHVRIQRPDHPVAEFPNLPRRIDRVAVAVRIPRLIEPPAPPALSIVRRGEEAIDDLLVGVRSGIGEKGVHLHHRRRQPDEIERDPADERGLIGLGRGREAFLSKPCQDEMVDRIADNGARDFDRRDGRPLRRGKRPMALIFGALGDPFADGLDLRGRDGLVQLGRRHDLVGISARQPIEHLALLRMAGNDRRIPGLRWPGRAFPLIEPHAALPLGPVRSVALEAGVGENGADVAIERDLIRGVRDLGGGKTCAGQSQQRCGKEESRSGWRQKEHGRKHPSIARNGAGR